MPRDNMMLSIFWLPYFWTPKPPPLAAAADFFDRLAAAADKKFGLAG